MTEPRPLDFWRRLGLRTAANAPLPSGTMPASVIETGPRTFLTYRNYDALLGYNCAHNYALSVALLADRFALTPGRLLRSRPVGGRRRRRLDDPERGDGDHGQRDQHGGHAIVVAGHERGGAEHHHGQEGLRAGDDGVESGAVSRQRSGLIREMNSRLSRSETEIVASARMTKNAMAPYGRGSAQLPDEPAGDRCQAVHDGDRGLVEPPPPQRGRRRPYRDRAALAIEPQAANVLQQRRA